MNAVDGLEGNETEWLFCCAAAWKMPIKVHPDALAVSLIPHTHTHTHNRCLPSLATAASWPGPAEPALLFPSNVSSHVTVTRVKERARLLSQQM